MSGAARGYDAVIIGAGMAGASLGAELAAHGSVLLVEMEDQPGYHATGRSVAFWSESYGGPAIRPLTQASGPFLERPPAEFAAHGFLSARGGIHIGHAGDAALRQALVAEHGDDGLFRLLEEQDMRGRLPRLRAGWTIGLEEASLRDIDVAALHGAYLSCLRRRGGVILPGNRFAGARRLGASEGWEVRLATGTVRAGVLINAAGAWADDVARAAGVAPLGIVPLRRTVAQVRVDPPAPDDMPLILDLAQRFYFKPVGGGRIWLTPHDEHPSPATDAAPEEVDVAIAIDRLQAVMDWRVEAVERRWAGLRSFAPDRKPVYGRDPDAPGFFWFAGQGGFGIQTAPAAARLALGLLTGGGADPMTRGLDAAAYAPDRLRASALSSPAKNRQSEPRF
ncbi:MAG: FAD-dependent oxidoreductase [Sphingobium sp. 32-64-5]|nr:MAG: FAD-dependent oxidoreductase [Sphingobium sp. 32-64-5]